MNAHEWGWRTAAVAAALGVMACGDDSSTTAPEPEPEPGAAVVQGRIEREAPATSDVPAAFATAGARAAETVAVVEIGADGSFETLAEADVRADGSFRVEGVPAGRTDLAVVAFTGGAASGRVLVHERTRAGATITTAPIDLETTFEGRVWTRMRAMGRSNATSTAEVALFARADASADASLVAEGEVDAAARGMAEAGEALTRIHAGLGSALDAAARADLLLDAAVAHARGRHEGAASADAQDAFVEAALDAFAGADVDLESTVIASAGAISVADAQAAAAAEGRVALVAELVRVNVRARERLAARFTSSSEGAVALAIVEVLAATRAELRGVSTAAEIRAALAAGAGQATTALARESVELLVPDGSVLARLDVETQAEAAAEAARLGARFEAAANARAAAEAVASYRAAVRSAVQSMVEASQRTDVDVDVMTSLFIAAHGSGHVR